MFCSFVWRIEKQIIMCCLQQARRQNAPESDGTTHKTAEIEFLNAKTIRKVQQSGSNNISDMETAIFGYERHLNMVDDWHRKHLQILKYSTNSFQRQDVVPATSVL